ncbi:hypothetical protein KA021_00215 [Candidatus Saccharibacteria bacterium]|jgi:hypothetical protein|nr:hypothetical protein [Candidatus Saccharibacteria bacterium]
MSEVFIGESPSTVAEGENAEGSVSSAEQSSALEKRRYCAAHREAVLGHTAGLDTLGVESEDTERGDVDPLLAPASSMYTSIGLLGTDDE